MSGLAGQEVTGKILDERVAISVQRGRTGLTVELTFMEFENLMRDLRRRADVDPFGIPGGLFGDPPPRRGAAGCPAHASSLPAAATCPTAAAARPGRADGDDAARPPPSLGPLRAHLRDSEPRVHGRVRHLPVPEE